MRLPASATMTGAEKRAGVGYVYLHCVIDDHSRYAYVEQHPTRAGTPRRRCWAGRSSTSPRSA